MALDHWLIEQTQSLRTANTPAEAREIIALLEDRYDAFSGPGEAIDPVRKKFQCRLAFRPTCRAQARPSSKAISGRISMNDQLLDAARQRLTQLAG